MLHWYLVSLQLNDFVHFITVYNVGHSRCEITWCQDIFEYQELNRRTHWVINSKWISLQESVHVQTFFLELAELLDIIHEIRGVQSPSIGQCPCWVAHTSLLRGCCSSPGTSWLSLLCNFFWFKFETWSNVSCSLYQLSCLIAVPDATVLVFKLAMMFNYFIFPISQCY